MPQLGKVGLLRGNWEAELEAGVEGLEFQEGSRACERLRSLREQHMSEDSE